MSEKEQIDPPLAESVIDLKNWDRLKLKPGDIVLLTPDRPMLHERAAMLNRQLQDIGKKLGVQFMLVPSGWTASVLTPASEEPTI